MAMEIMARVAGILDDLPARAIKDRQRWLLNPICLNGTKKSANVAVLSLSQ